MIYGSMPKDEGLELAAIQFIFSLYLLNDFIQATNNEACIQPPQWDAHLAYQCLVESIIRSDFFFCLIKEICPLPFMLFFTYIYLF